MIPKVVNEKIDYLWVFCKNLFKFLSFRLRSEFETTFSRPYYLQLSPCFGLSVVCIWCLFLGENYGNMVHALFFLLVILHIPDKKKFDSIHLAEEFMDHADFVQTLLDKKWGGLLCCDYPTRRFPNTTSISLFVRISLLHNRRCNLSTPPSRPLSSSGSNLISSRSSPCGSPGRQGWAPSASCSQIPDRKSGSSCVFLWKRSSPEPDSGLFYLTA